MIHIDKLYKKFRLLFLYIAMGVLGVNSNEIKKVYLFVHGFCNSVEDMAPLVQLYQRKGNQCENILLPGHGATFDDLEKTRYVDWYDHVSDRVQYWRDLEYSVYIVGFSIGATIALEIAATNAISGLLLISPYFGRKRDALYILFMKMMLSLGIRKILRIPQTTSSHTRKEIVYSKYIPVDLALRMLQDVNARLHGFSIECPVLIVHSLDDNVASYKKMVNFFIKNDIHYYKIITLRELNHYVQFDIPPPRIYNLWVEYIEKYKIDADGAETFSKMRDQCYIEERHWSGIMFQLITGFFTIFGTLLYFSLEDVVKQSERAPYYVLGYSLLISIFLVLTSMYFFYIIRILVFMNNFVDSAIKLSGPYKYRRLRWYSGSCGSGVTGATSTAIIALPLILSTTLLVYFCFHYGGKIFVWEGGCLSLQIFFLASTCLYIKSIQSLYKLNQYTQKELKTAKPTPLHHGDVERRVFELYESVNPGCVRQRDWR